MRNCLSVLIFFPVRVCVLGAFIYFLHYRVGLTAGSVFWVMLGFQPELVMCKTSILSVVLVLWSLFGVLKEGAVNSL